MKGTIKTILASKATVSVLFSHQTMTTTLRFVTVGTCCWMLLAGSCKAFQGPVIVRGSLSVEQQPKIHGNIPMMIPYYENHFRLSSTNSEYPDYDDFEFDYHKYYNNDMQQQVAMEDDNDYDSFFSSSETTSDEDRRKIQLTNQVLRALHYSFKNVENMANGLLEKDPLSALIIFVGAGLMAAYLLGLVILDGCMESWNPIQNGFVPYWDEEILVMVRKIH
jgi:hypothetical protein